MAHNNRTRASLAAWNSGVVTPAEFNKLDTQAFESINGDQGGVWAPATVIELGGAGLLVSGPFEATGTSDLDATDFHGDVNILTGNNFQARGDVFLGNDSGDAVTVEGTSAFNAPATFNYALTVNSSAVFNDNAQFNDTVAFIGLAVFADDVNFAEPVNFEDNVTFEDPVDFDDDVDFAVGTTVTIRGDAHIGTDAGDDVLVGGTATFDAPVTFTDDVSIFSSGGFDCNADATFDGNVVLGANSGSNVDVLAVMTLHQPLQYTFKGRVPYRPVIGPDGAQTYDVSECNCIYVPSISNNQNCFIDDTGAVDGDFFEITLASSIPHGASASVLYIDLQGGGRLATLFAGTAPAHVKLVRISGIWRATMPQGLGS